MSVVVELCGITRSFPGVRALLGVDVALRSGSIHALIGENGAGKSTLINILSGVLAPDGGEIRVAGHPVRLDNPRAARRAGIVTVHQEADLFPDLSVAENMGLEQGLPVNRLGWIDWRRQWQRTRDAFAAVGESIPPGMPAGKLTGAQRQMVEIAAAVSQSARLLILDEPTSSLSEAETSVLFEHLRRFRTGGTAILYVSHRLEEIFALADEVTVLRDGRRAWSGALAETTPAQLIRRMVGREMAAATKRETPLPGPVRLACDRLTASDDSFRDVTLEVRAGEVLGLYGLVGAGRSEWAQAVFGLRPLARGEVRLDGRPLIPRHPGQMARHGLAYVPEDRLRQGLCRDLSVRANAVLASLRRLGIGPWMPRMRESQQTTVLVNQLAIRLHSIEQPIGTLSGGNQQKVVLGRWLCREPEVLILDEPTRGVDVGAKAEIHGLIHRLAREGRAVVLISSDLPEAVCESDRVGVFREGRLVAFFDPGTSSAQEIAAAAVPTGTAVRSSAPRSIRRPPLAGAREAALLAIVVIFFILLQGSTGDFLEPDRVRTLLTDTALLSFAAVGAALVIIAGGLDISLGSLMALSAGVAGRLWEQGYPLPVVVATALLVGGAGGCLNAALSLVGRVHPIVVTLGTMSVYRGLTLWWLGQDVQIPNSARGWVFTDLSSLPWIGGSLQEAARSLRDTGLPLTRIFTDAVGMPLIVWGGLAFVVGVWLVLTRTVPGRQLYALGGNPSAARRVSISPARVWLVAFMLQGLLVGLAGLLLLARSGSMQPTSYEDNTLLAIAAAVVGGVAITGGRGSMWGVALGCLFLVSLAPASVALHLTADWQRTLVGCAMVLAVLADGLWRRRGA
jgi:ABC-type sugar transport system ATPase subunit/ribose/xylose/arabinose/galactoside ABC-type transport system permease subunit